MIYLANVFGRDLSVAAFEKKEVGGMAKIVEAPSLSNSLARCPSLNSSATKSIPQVEFPPSNEGFDQAGMGK